MQGAPGKTHHKNHKSTSKDKMQHQIIPYPPLFVVLMYLCDFCGEIKKHFHNLQAASLRF